MKNKVILISIDGVRSDAIRKVNHPTVDFLIKNGTYSLNNHSIMNTLTLPCHFSMLMGVSSKIHGTIDYKFIPQENPAVSIFEQVHAVGGRTGMFFGWDPLRDVVPPEKLVVSYCINAKYTYVKWNVDDTVDAQLTNKMIEYLKDDKLDFAFLYLPDVDHFGHNYGWMSEQYLNSLNIALDNVKRVIDNFKGEYTIVVTTDHGGHDKRHGTDMDEDMIIPAFFLGEDIPKKNEISSMSILDITPTISKIMGLDDIENWEGKSVL